MTKTVCCIAMTVLFSCSTKNQQPEENVPAKKTPISINAGGYINPYQPVDASPMDMSYFPTDFAKEKTGNTMPVMRIIYSRPQLNKRVIFEQILKYGKVWRLGANEATEIEFFQPVTIMNKPIKAGRYIIYCIPEKTQWTLVLNSDLYSWGLLSHVSKDIERFTIPVMDKQPHAEYFTAVFEKTDNGADLIFAWGEWICRLPIRF